METIVAPFGPACLAQAREWLRCGQTVAFPTDTVYGLGAALDDPQAIEMLFTVKGRQASKAIAVLVGEAQAAETVGRMQGYARHLAQRFWPGPLTLVVEQLPGLPANLAPHSNVGLRMPDHPVALALLRLTGPLAVTSANLSGQANTITAQEVLAQLGGRIPFIVDGGQTPGGQPSTVVDCTGVQPALLRSGPVAEEDIFSLL